MLIHMDQRYRQSSIAALALITGIEREEALAHNKFRLSLSGRGETGATISWSFRPTTAYI